MPLNSAELAQVAANPSKPIDVTCFGGRVRCQQATIVVTAAITAPETINLFKIPKGGKVVSMFTIATATLNTGTFSIGDSSSATKYRADGVHTTTAYTPVAIPGTAAVLAGYGSAYTADTTIFATVNTTIPITGTPVLIIGCNYVVD